TIFCDLEDLSTMHHTRFFGNCSGRTIMAIVFDGIPLLAWQERSAALFFANAHVCGRFNLRSESYFRSCRDAGTCVVSDGCVKARAGWLALDVWFIRARSGDLIDL